MVTKYQKFGDGYKAEAVKLYRYYSPGLLLTGWAVAGARGAGLTEGNGHLTIMVCETSEQRGGRRGHRR